MKELQAALSVFAAGFLFRAGWIAAGVVARWAGIFEPVATIINPPGVTASVAPKEPA